MSTALPAVRLGAVAVPIGLAVLIAGRVCGQGPGYGHARRRDNEGGPMRLGRSLAAAAIVGAMTLAACAGPPAAPAQPAGSADTAGSAPAAAAVDLTFAVPTLDGGTFHGTSLRGRPALLWFWAPWCPTCAAEAPEMTRLAGAYAGRAHVVGVAGLSEVDAMRRFVALTGVSSFPQLADDHGVVWQRFGVTAQSTYVVLDAAGVVVARGYLRPEQLTAQLDRLAG